MLRLALPALVLASLLALAAPARAEEPLRAASIDSTVVAGPLVLHVHVARTAQVFHVVDQLANWSEFCHDQYALALQLSPEERALLDEHTRIRARHDWGSGLEQAFYTTEGIAAAASRAVAAKQLDAAEAATERRILEAFERRLAPTLEAAAPRLRAFVERLGAEAPRVAELARKLAALCEVQGPIEVPVFPIWNPSPDSLGGGFNGGRLTVEVPTRGDAVPTFLHEAFHVVLDRRMEAIAAAANKEKGLDPQTLDEGIAYALMPGLIHEGRPAEDPLADQVKQDRKAKRTLEHADVRFNRLGLAIRPLLARALEGGASFDAFLADALKAWARVRDGRDDGRALEPVGPADLPDFAADDLDRASLKQAIAEERRLLVRRTDVTVSLGGVETTRRRLLETLERLEKATDGDRASLVAAIASGFACYRSVGSDGAGAVLFTGYHSPCYEGSRTRTDACPWPLRRAPDEGCTLTRREIEVEKKLDGRGLEVVWLARRLDAYLLEVQGSGSVRFADGTTMRVQCSKTNGKPYTSLGKELVKDGKIPADKVSIPAIREYLAAHPEDTDEYLCRNASYVFFAETKEPPRGCAGAAVTPLRSIATDKKYFPAGALAFIVVEMPVCENGVVVGWKKRARFVVDQDTGGAIVGPGRVDIYMGADADADAAAGVMKRDGQLYYLLAR